MILHQMISKETGSKSLWKILYCLLYHVQKISGEHYDSYQNFLVSSSHLDFTTSDPPTLEF